MRRWFLSAVVLLLLSPAVFPGARAEEAAFSLKPGEMMRDVLTHFTGKRLALRLESGEEIEGTITTVGNSLVQVSRLSGKEFYDSVVSIDRITAVRMRAREK